MIHSTRFGIMLADVVHCIPTLRTCDQVKPLLSEWMKGQIEGGTEGEIEEGLEGWCPDAADISPRKHL